MERVKAELRASASLLNSIEGELVEVLEINSPENCT